MKPVLRHPPHITTAVMAMIIEPEPPRKDYGQWGEADGAGERKDVVEDGDDFGEDECEDGNRDD